MQKNFILMTIFAFLGIGMLFTTDSVFAEQYTPYYMWTGIVSVLVAIFFLYKVAKEQKENESNSDKGKWDK